MRIIGINIPEDKRLEIGLTAVYGIGRSISMKVLKEAKISFDKRPKELSSTEINNLRELIEKHRIEGDLRREILMNIKRLKDIKSYRGIRHIKRLPVRGQRTKTNSRTARPYKGRITMGSGKRKTEKK